MINRMGANVSTTRPLRKVSILRSYYFLYFLAMGAFSFIQLHFRSLGLSGVQIGTLGALMPLIGLISQPIWGAVSDIKRSPNLVLRMTLLMTAIMASLASFAHSYYWLIPAMAALALSQNANVPLADSITLSVLPQSVTYGSIRLWGSLGYAAGVLLVGQILNWMGVRFAFPIYALFLFATFLTGLLLPQATRERSPSLRSGIKNLLVNPKISSFLIFYFVLSMTLAMNMTFFGIHLSELGANPGVIGVALVLATVFEVPVLFYSGQLIRRMGMRSFLCASGGLYILRWALLSIIHNPLLILATQLLHGFTFISTYVAGVSIMDEESPSELKSTAQALMGSLSFAGGSSAGTLVGGLLYDSVGAFGMYRVCALLAIGVTLGFYLFSRNSACWQTDRSAERSALCTSQIFPIKG
ncbi:MAG TPA: MFS transporter [Firmicutes bacterium]|nr:MFS transporter [Bacillota bacterium]